MVRGDAAHPVNRGLACQRGIRESAESEGEWLTRPQVRRDGELVPTTWDVALSEVIQAFQDVEAAADEVAVVGGGQQTNEAAYALSWYPLRRRREPRIHRRPRASRSRRTTEGDRDSSGPPLGGRLRRHS